MEFIDKQLAIAGRLSSNTQQTGEILINGRKETLAFGISVCKKGHVCIMFTYGYVMCLIHQNTFS